MGVVDEVLQRTEAQRLVGHLADERVDVDRVGDSIGEPFDDSPKRGQHAGTKRRIIELGGVDLSEVEVLEKAPMDFPAQLGVAGRSLDGLRRGALAERQGEDLFAALELAGR